MPPLSALSTLLSTLLPGPAAFPSLSPPPLSPLPSSPLLETAEGVELHFALSASKQSQRLEGQGKRVRPEETERGQAQGARPHASRTSVVRWTKSQVGASEAPSSAGARTSSPSCAGTAKEHELTLRASGPEQRWSVDLVWLTCGQCRGHRGRSWRRSAAGQRRGERGQRDSGGRSARGSEAMETIWRGRVVRTSVRFGQAT
ncbi:hypothetical protein DMC30DRAFT_398490 [Rhodotorula diobovata]|uniref:Uncharacterized protein n=1 Tax=Rhodotorula diobovata TaxID=5288 RepID=A0A5C5FWU1_9BASI|nr:hypothetical protein DMC30DRAFT_398490 [Rhodotorula diobovata]